MIDAVVVCSEINAVVVCSEINTVVVCSEINDVVVCSEINAVFNVETDGLTNEGFATVVGNESFAGC